jgi:hypothetical protein
VSNPTTAQKVPFSITPADADGKPVDLVANPTALSSIFWSVDAKAVADITFIDATHVELVPLAPGTVSLTVRSTNVLGTELTQTSTPITFDDVVAPPPPVPVVTALGLAAADPVSK